MQKKKFNFYEVQLIKSETDLRLLVSRTKKEHISVGLSHQVGGNFYSSRRKLINLLMVVWVHPLHVLQGLG